MGTETGQHEWLSAIVLKAFLGRFPALIHGRRVLELGSGVGSSGLAAVDVGAMEVTFTDAEEARPVLARLGRCVADLNAAPGGICEESVGRHRVRGFTWGRLPSFVLDLDRCPPQVLLAADCLYDSSQFEDFVASVSFLLHRDPTSLLLMTYHERSENRNIGALLKAYGLQACLVPLDVFMEPADIDRLSAHIELSIIQALPLCSNPK